MTQPELAETPKVTPQAVSRWEMDVSYPDIAMIPKISDVLQVTADDLLGIKSSNESQEPGADAFVVKPFQAQCLINRIGELKELKKAPYSAFFLCWIGRFFVAGDEEKYSVEIPN